MQTQQFLSGLHCCCQSRVRASLFSVNAGNHIGSLLTGKDIHFGASETWSGVSFGVEKTRCSRFQKQQVRVAEPKLLGQTLEKMRSSLPTDVSLGTAVILHDIIQRFPWYPLIGCPRRSEQGEGAAVWAGCDKLGRIGKKA